MLPNDRLISILHAQREQRANDEVRARRLPSQRAPSSVRRSVGRSMIRIGQRIAAEPFELARSR